MPIPSSVYGAFDTFSKNANKTDKGTHPYDQNRFFKAVEDSYASGYEIDYAEFDDMLKQQGWTNPETRRELFNKYAAAWSMTKYLKTGQSY